MESPQGDPTTPGVARMRLPGQTGRQGGQPTHRAGQAARGQLQPRPTPCSLPQVPTPSACPARLPRLPASHLARMCHIVNESATRASRKTAFCQALLPFSNLSKRYILIHSHLSPH